MLKLIKKNIGLFIGLIFIYSVFHLIAVVITTALMTGWHDTNIIGILLGIALYSLIPFLFVGKNVAFLGLWIYFFSALIWAIPLSILSCYLIGRYKDKREK